jgi:succinoglycan biosynthesis protein ExoL
VVKLAYFVHDLADPAVTRRVRMLQAGGAEPVVLGFRRTETAPETVAGVPAIDLGRTYDARLGHRAKSTALAALRSGRWRKLLAGSQAVMARTLEMLAVADAARRTCGLTGPLTYECLDIHRLMLGEGIKSQAMRAVEAALLRRADLLIVSSPAFLDAYFKPRQRVGRAMAIETLLVENKVLELGGDRAVKPPPRTPGPPWRIGWMGAIRCRKSLDILTALAAKRPDLVEVQIHGRPAYTEFADFDGQVAATPNVSFGGAYTAADLPRLYGDVHFSWAVDYMEEGLNSSWLLPNRIYESGRFGATPIALRGVQTGQYLGEQDFGVRLDDPSQLEAFLDQLTPDGYTALRRRLDAVPTRAFVASEPDCRQLVRKIVGGSLGDDQGAEDAAPKATLVA